VALDPLERYARRFDDAIPSLIEAAARARVFLQRLADAGLQPDDIKDTASLDRIPIVAKDHVLDLQAKDPPFGGLVPAGFKPARVFQSPGPLYEAQRSGPDPWRWGPALAAAGFGDSDLVFNAFSYHLSPAGAMFEEAALALGATVVPGGVGSLELQARACRDLGVTSYIGLPSYLKALWEAGESDDLRPETWGLVRAFLAAEPLPASTRGWLEERIPIVRQGYGTAETGNLGFECEEVDGWHVPEDALVTICDLDTGRASWDDADGQVVVTLLSGDSPLIRFGTGDLSRWIHGRCGCGRTSPRLAGWLGRVGEAVKVRGMFLHPRQVSVAMAKIPDVRDYRFIVDRVDHKDALRCQVVPNEGMDRETLRAKVKERVRSGLRFDVDVEVVDRLKGDEGQIVDRRDWR
jgi:phenylacetate-CoA ligase